MRKTPIQWIIIVLIIVVVSFFGSTCFGQKIAPYKYGEVDTVRQYHDAQIISYKNKNGKQCRDTIWSASQKKDIIIDWSRVVETWDAYLKPRFKTTSTKKSKQ